MTADEKLTMLEKAIALGKTVYVGTYHRGWTITPKTVQKWRDAGLNLFFSDGKSLYMRRGRHADCIDYCALRVLK